MALIALKCPSCNGEIQLDDSKEFGFCMHCGTKVMLQETVNRSVKIDNSDKLGNLIKIGKHAISSNSASDTQDISNKILELDADNWFGWFLKGAAAAKVSQCQDMYDAWVKAAEFVSAEEYNEYRPEFIRLAAEAYVGYNPETSKLGNPALFINAIHEKEPEEENRFAIEVLSAMAKMPYRITADNAYDVKICASNLAHAELILFPDLRCFMASYEKVIEVNNVIVSSTPYARNVDPESMKLFNNVNISYDLLYEALEKCDYDDEDFDAAADYWMNHDMDEYLDYFDDADELCVKLLKAGSLSAMKLKKQIKKNLDSLIATYFSHN